MEQKNLVQEVRSLLDSGLSPSEVVRELVALGVSEDEARKLIIYANREMLSLIREELESIAEVSVKNAEDRIVARLRRYVEEAKKDVKMDLEVSMKKELRSLIDSYLREVRTVRDRMDIIEKRLIDVENRVFGIEEGDRKRRQVSVLPLGSILLVVALLAETDFLLKVVALGVGTLLVIWGVIRG